MSSGSQSHYYVDHTLEGWHEHDKSWQGRGGVPHTEANLHTMRYTRYTSAVPRACTASSTRPRWPRAGFAFDNFFRDRRKGFPIRMVRSYTHYVAKAFTVGHKWWRRDPAQGAARGIATNVDNMCGMSSDSDP